MPNYGKGRNLLDNWDFRNPVDQRGGYVVPPGVMLYQDSELTIEQWAVGGYEPVEAISSGVAKLKNYNFYCRLSDCVRGYTGAGHAISMWRFAGYGGTMIITDEGVHIHRETGSFCSFDTRLENWSRFAGKTFTWSILTADDLYSASFTLPDSKPAGEVYQLLYPTEIGELGAGSWDGLDGLAVFVNHNGATIHDFTLIAAKLELGTQQTLAHQDESGNWVLNDPPPDYGEELAKCQRYYRQINLRHYPTCYVDGYIGGIPFGTPMRAAPTVTAIEVIKTQTWTTVTPGTIETTADGINLIAVPGSKYGEVYRISGVVADAQL